MFRVKNSEEINFRVDFPLLCNSRKVSVAVEIGTDRGWFAKKFIERFKGEQLICVDPYLEYEELPGKRTADQMMAILAVMPWHDRVRFYQTTSAEAAEKFPWWYRDRVGFVYIDAQHTYTEAKRDIKLWWPLLMEGGILAGHDYDETHPGVMRAVDEFAKKEELTVRIVAGDKPQSWYVYKGGEPTILYKHFFYEGEVENIND